MASIVNGVFAEQQDIVRRVESLSGQADPLETRLLAAQRVVQRPRSPSLKTLPANWRAPYCIDVNKNDGATNGRREDVPAMKKRVRTPRTRPPDASRSRSNEITIRFVCRRLPGWRICDAHPGQPNSREPVWLGIQRGREVINAVPANRRQVIFDAPFRVEKCGREGVQFYGPFAQGRAGERFVYLSWNVRHPDGRLEMFRRLKIPLWDFCRPQISHALRTGKPLVALLELTDKSGGPLCGSARAPHLTWRF
jgi:hypothetical protein